MSESMLACVRKGPGDIALERIPRPVLEAPTGVTLKTRLCTIYGTNPRGESIKIVERPSGNS